ncbi:MAG TPA: N-formylglutamate amidohydrolase [Planctomycetota bacterium]|nr:N-formylglutamate amidohydrolase [Planctomycetota bacterium]
MGEARAGSAASSRRPRRTRPGRAGLELLLTCEHGGHSVPARWRPLFRGQRRLLASHRGWDIGALRVARALARRLDVPLVASTTTRLLVDLNRSLGHRKLLSELTRGLPREERARLIERHWRPHRAEVERRCERSIAAGRRVLHVAVHSFTPVLDGQVREVDVGLLYDPARALERRIGRAMQRELARALPKLRVRRNQPYHGTSDGLTTHLRRRFDAGAYAGIELELNQALLGDKGEEGLVRAVEDALRTMSA